MMPSTAPISRPGSLRRAALASTLLLLVGLGGVPGPLAGQDQRVRVAVVDFANNSSWTYWGPQLGAAAANQLAGELLRSGEFVVVERSRLEAVMAEQALGQSGAIDASTAATLGELLGVQAILTGAVTQFSLETRSTGFGPARVTRTEAESVLDARLVDTSTGEVLVAVEGSGDKQLTSGALGDIDYTQTFNVGVAQEALRPAVEATVQKIVEAKSSLAALAPPPTPPGTIVGRRDSVTVFIDRGNGHGVTEGQRFAVFQIVDEIRNAEGELLDVLTEKAGVVEVTRVLENSSICRVVEGEAAEGDQVRALR